MGDRQRKPDCDGCVNGIPAVAQYVQTDAGSQRFRRNHHCMPRIYGMGRAGR
jgi:hypothetical protein